MQDQTVCFRKLLKCPVQHICDLLERRISGQIISDDLICSHVQYRREIAFAPGKRKL